MMNPPVHVLFIEDNPGDARLIREELAQSGMAGVLPLTWVDRLDKGLEHLRGGQIEAVLLDLSLPDSHGLDTLERVLEAAPAIPVIVMTGTADETIAMQAVQAGAQDYLIKGLIDGVSLARAIRYAVERKRSELQLRELAAIVEHSQDVIFRKDLDGIIRSWNRGAELMYGYAPEEIIGRSVSILMQPEKHQEMEQFMEEIRMGRKVERFETERIRKDGTRILVSVNVSPICDEQGKIVAASTVAHDITAKKQAEEALRNSEMRLNNILSNAAEAIIVVNDREEITLFNHSAQKEFGWTEAEILGQPLSLLIPGRFAEIHHAHIRSFARSPETTRDMEARQRLVCVRRDGSEFTSTIGISKHMENGRMFFTAIVQDITEKMRADEAVQQMRDRFQALTENAPDGVALVDMYQRMQFVSPAGRRMFGYSLQEQIELDPAEHTHPEDLPKIVLALSRLIEDPAYIPTLQYRFRHRDGSWRWLESTFTNLLDVESIQAIVINFRDISERRQAEDALRQSEKRFRSLIENGSDMVSILAADGTLLYESPSANPMLGYPLGEFNGQSLFQLVHPEDLERVQHEFVSLLQEPGLHRRQQFRLKHRDGTWRWVDAVGTNLLADPSVGGIVVNYHDITDRREAEKKIAFQADLLGAVGSAVIATDLAGNVIYWNRAAEALYGWSAAEAQGRRITDLTPAQETKEQALEIMDNMRRGQPWSGEFFVRSRDGKVFPAFVSNSPLLDETGTLTGIIGISSDISKLKQAEKLLLERKALLDKSQEIAHVGSWELDLTANRLTWSDEVYRIFGLRPQEFGATYQAFLDAVHPDDRAAVDSAYTGSLQQGAGGYQIEHRIVRRDTAEVRTVLEKCEHIRDEAGRILRSVGVVQDITERKQAEERNRQQLRRLSILRKIDQGITGSVDLRSVLDIILKEGMTELGVDAAVVLLYDPGEQMLKYERGTGMRTAALQHTHLKLGEGYAGRAALSRQTLFIPDLLKRNTDFLRSPMFSLEGFACYFAVPLIAKDEIKGVLEIFHRASVEPEQEWLDFMETLAGQTAIAIDNALLWEKIQRQTLELEQRVAERTAELQQANLELEHANRAKDEFLATMSHELRTPLNSILGLSESLLEQRRDPLSEYQQGSLRIVEASGRHLLDLINDILDLSKIEAGKLDYYPQVVDVSTLCRASLSFIKEQAVRKSISLVYPEKHTDLRIHADPRRLKQALVNLLTNAVKFTPEHGQVTLEVHSEPEEDRVHFSVTDTGIGIADKDLKQLFQPFVQVDSSLNRQYEGTGLGLVLVERLTDLHGGSVQVESAPGRGSRFTIIIPWRQQVVAEQEIIEAGGELPAGETPPKPAAPPRNVTVLLAEDNPANTLTISEYLESHGYRVVNAYDGLDAIEKAESVRPHVILMDIQMPAMDGLEAIRRLRAIPHFAKTPIIALTALAMPGDRERCLQAGANEYMSKPVSLKTLAKTIEDLLRSR